MSSSTFCVMPFIGTQFNATGLLTPCCRYNTDDINFESWDYSNFNNWWNVELQPLRNDLLNGVKHARCQNCWRDEELGIRSYRQMINAELPDLTGITQQTTYPTYQFYGLGNFCNLKCIMCSPALSSSIETEYFLNEEKYNKIGRHWIGDIEAKWYRSPAFLKLREQLTEYADTIHLTGGEPLLTPDYIALLEQIPDPTKVQVIVITNGTKIDDHVFELLTRFKHVQLMISIEGTGSLNEYIRYGSSWSQTVANIERAKSAGFYVAIAHTFQRTSLYSFVDLAKFANSTGLKLITNFMSSPEELTINSATDEEKTKFVDRLNELDYIDPEKFVSAGLKDIAKAVQDSVYDPELDRKFWQYIDMLDSIRKTKFRDIFILDKTGQ